MVLVSFLRLETTDYTSRRLTRPRIAGGALSPRCRPQAARDSRVPVSPLTWRGARPRAKLPAFR